jgi:hypothetical protein
MVGKWITLLVLLLLGASPSLGASLKGSFVSMTSLRLADGKQELAVIEADESKPKKRRTLRWFAKRGKDLKEAGSVLLDPDIVAYDRCQLDPKSKAETLLFIKPDGLYQLGRKTPFLKSKNLFAHSRDDALFSVRICFNLFPNEPPALIIPVIEGIQIYRQKKIGLFEAPVFLPNEAEIKMFGRLGDAVSGDSQRVYVAYDFAKIQTIDFDGNGTVDICMSGQEDLRCFLQSPKGFDPQNSKSFHFDLLNEDEKHNSSMRAGLQVIHLNGDKQADVLYKKSFFNLSGMYAEIMVFHQNKGGFASKPNQSIKRDGYFDTHQFMDLDQDGLLDLLAPVKSISWPTLASMYLSKSMEVSFVWYKNLGDKGFAKEASEIMEVVFPLDFKNMSGFLGRLPIWEGAFTKKSKKRQVVFFFDPNLVQVYEWDNKKYLAESPLLSQEMDIGGSVHLVDMDGDGLNEFVMAWPNDPKLGKRIELKSF